MRGNDKLIGSFAGRTEVEFVRFDLSGMAGTESAGLHAATAARRFNLCVGFTDYFIESRLDSGGFVVTFESQQALVVAVQGPDIIRVLRATR